MQLVAVFLRSSSLRFHKSLYLFGCIYLRYYPCSNFQPAVSEVIAAEKYDFLLSPYFASIDCSRFSLCLSHPRLSHSITVAFVIDRLQRRMLAWKNTMYHGPSSRCLRRQVKPHDRKSYHSSCTVLINLRLFSTTGLLDWPPLMPDSEQLLKWLLTTVLQSTTDS
jgi:hypothetical protein